MYMLDTNICIYLLKNRPLSLQKKFESVHEVSISSVVYAELCFGVESSPVHLQEPRWQAGVSGWEIGTNWSRGFSRWGLAPIGVEALAGGVGTELKVGEHSPAKASTPPAKASTPPAKASTPLAKASTPPAKASMPLS